MPLQATSGAASYDAFGGGVVAEPNYIESCFSTYLYTGNDGAQTINNGIDLSGKGGLVWTKCRTFAGTNYLKDTAAATGNNYLSSNTTAALTFSNISWATNSTGYSFNTGTGPVNYLNETYVSWTFRKQPKFFDVVTYTGNGASYQDVAHSLGSTPGCIMVKCTSTGSTNWMVAHRASALVNANLILNSTASAATIASETIAYSSVDGSFNGYFRVLNDLGTADPNNYLNVNGRTYVAYLFAHNAGGFGLTGTDNVISCGSYTGNGSATGPVVTLGYEPQWLLIKAASGTGNWYLLDNMRGIFVESADPRIFANTSAAENFSFVCSPTATGFQVEDGFLNGSGTTYIYIAIRRGPMKVPTDGTSVFDIQQYTGTQSSNPGVARNITTTIRTDVNITSAKNAGFDIGVFFDRLRGPAQYIGSNSTNSEGTMPGSAAYQFWNDKYILGGYYLDYTGYQYVNYSLQRSPGFFDEVCYTGNSVTPRTITHNLGVAPELMFIKCRNQSRGWAVYASGIGAGKYLIFNGTNAALTDTTIWVNTAPTSSVFTVGDPFDVNNTAYTYVAYLFATCAGVSKVGSYTGNGSTQTIDCGFTGGARFVLIKRTDSTGGWYVYDTARGMTVLTDPYLLLNDTAAETATLGSVTTVSTGFAVNATILAAINTNAASYIFLAIA